MFCVALTSLSLLLSLLAANILLLHSCLQIQSTAGGAQTLRGFFPFSLGDVILITLRKPLLFVGSLAALTQGQRIAACCQRLQPDLIHELTQHPWDDDVSFGMRKISGKFPQ